jgi:hypothetical protein
MGDGVKVEEASMSPGELAVVDPGYKNGGAVVYSGTAALDSDSGVEFMVPASWLHNGCIVVVLSNPLSLAHECLYVLVVGVSNKTEIGWVMESRLKRLA